MQKPLIIVLVAIIVGGMAVLGFMYMSAATTLQQAKEEAKQEQMKQEVQAEQEREQAGGMDADDPSMTSDFVDTPQDIMDKVTTVNGTVTTEPVVIPPGSAEVTVTLEGADGISGFNIAFEAPEGVLIESVADQVTVEGGPADEFEQILNNVSADQTSAKVSYVTLSLNDDELPSMITFSVTVSGTGSDMPLTIMTEESEMVGPAATQYEIEQL